MPYTDSEKRKEASRRHYQKHKAKYIARTKAYSQKHREKVYEYKKTTPCKDCGQQHPHYVMEFDHVRGKKVSNIADILHRNHAGGIWKEIAKCELVCANCHRYRTYKRLQQKKKGAAKQTRAK
jgi:NAD-dependent dihydropyrimidine dehydrogenase PreA subunit